MNATEMVTGVTQGGKVWIPQFVQSIDSSKCIGCGRCFKVCGRDVMRLTPVDEDGAVIVATDEDEEFEKQVMILDHPERCVGCEACSRVCPKQCYTHGPLQAVRM